MVLPMVAPRDVGEFAADRLLSPVGDVGVRYVEGPERYSSSDVAQAFAEALGRKVEVIVIPRGSFRDAFREQGFSRAAANSYARMTEVCLDHGFDIDEDPLRGATTLQAYVATLVGGSGADNA